MPFDLGYTWYTCLDQSAGDFITPTASETRRTDSLRRTRKSLTELLSSLIDRCGWKSHQLFLLGFSMGAQVALDLAAHWQLNSVERARLGGLVTVSGGLLEEVLLRADPRECGHLGTTPVLVTYGLRDERVSVAQARAGFAFLKTRMTTTGGVQTRSTSTGSARIRTSISATEDEKNEPANIPITPNNLKKTVSQAKTATQEMQEKQNIQDEWACELKLYA